MRGVTLQNVAELTEKRALLLGELEGATSDWKGAIRAALAAGNTRTDIGYAAGVSRQRVVQIEEEGRAR